MERDRVLLLVTDGQVGNEDQILRQIAPSLTGIRVHVVGIDRAVNAGFLGRLASAGRGRCELVESEDRLDEAAARIHQRIGAPLVTGLALTADGLRILPESVAPGLLPDIFPGVPVTITGRWQGHAGGTLTVRGTASDGAPFEAVASAVTGGTPAAAANWARARLRDLEDRYATLAGHDTAALARLEHEITGVSLRYGVLCRFTAFVAVDSSVVTDGKAPHRVTQPVELPSGWGQQAPAAPVPVALAAASGLAPAPAAPRPGAPSGWVPQSGPPSGRRAKQTSGGAVGWTAAAGRPGQSRALSAANALSPAESADSVDRLGQVRRQLADEAAMLRAARPAPGAERARLLADLATRIDAALAWLADDTAASEAREARAELTRLADKLRDCDKPGLLHATELDSLWEEAIRQLTAFGTPPAPGETPAQPPEAPTPPFWKRSRLPEVLSAFLRLGGAGRGRADAVEVHQPLFTVDAPVRDLHI
jgi:Ca-activated chloride channel family protein